MKPEYILIDEGDDEMIIEVNIETYHDALERAKAYIAEDDPVNTKVIIYKSVAYVGAKTAKIEFDITKTKGD